MRRVFWLTLGATAGALAMRKMTKTVQAFTPTALGRRVEGVGDAFRHFVDEVRAGMAEREAQLRDALGLDDDVRELPPAQAVEVVEPSAAARRTGP